MGAIFELSLFLGYALSNILKSTCGFFSLLVKLITVLQPGGQQVKSAKSSSWGSTLKNVYTSCSGKVTLLSYMSFWNSTLSKGTSGIPHICHCYTTAIRSQEMLHMRVRKFATNVRKVFGKRKWKFLMTFARGRVASAIKIFQFFVFLKTFENRSLTA